MPRFQYRHIPPLLIATALTLGGTLPLYAPRLAMRDFGLPDRVASDPLAHRLFPLYGSNVSIYGLATWLLYLRGDLRGVDHMMVLLLYAASVQAYVCYLEGAIGSAWFRFGSGVVVSLWGMLGLTAGGQRGV